MKSLTLPTREDTDHIVKSLTSRQAEIIELLILGYNNKQIALLLSIKADTVKRQVFNAVRRAQIDNRVQLIVAYTMWKLQHAN